MIYSDVSKCHCCTTYIITIIMYIVSNVRLVNPAFNKFVKLNWLAEREHFTKL